MVEQPITSYEDLIKIVSDPGCKLVFEVRSISPAQNKLIDLIAKAVEAFPLKQGETRSLGAAFEAIFAWWDKLPEVSKVISLYEKERQSRLMELKNLLSGVGKSADRFDLILQQLPAIFNGGPVSEALTEKEAEALIEAFSVDVKLFNSGEQLAQRKVAGAICEIFGSKGDIIECEKAVTQWYSDLTPAQRNPQNYDQEASQLLTRLENQSVPFGPKLVKLLPKDFGFGAIADWSSLHTDDFAAKMKQAKAEIEKETPVVYKPDIEEKAHILQEEQTLLLKVPEGASKIIYTTDGSDPRKSDSAIVCDSALDLAKLLKDQPQVQVKIRALDRDGNASDMVSVELVNKAKEYDLQVKKNIFGDTEATFRCPKDREGLLAVLKSVVNYGTMKNLISVNNAENIRTTLTKLISEE
jgi:hypothetical protein